MYVDHLTLADFRSYRHVDLGLDAGVVTFVGANGQGKTNLVEAIDYLATLGSHRVSSDLPLVRHGADQATIKARVRAGRGDERALVLEIDIVARRANRARLNRSPLQRPRELLGILRTVVFSPEDLAIVKGDPSARRHFLDSLVATRWPRMAGVRQDYDKVLQQRNSLLKTLSGRGGRTPDPYAEDTLKIWNEQLAALGAEVLSARLDTLAALMPHTSRAYADIAPTNNVATAGYRSSLEPTSSDRAELAAALLAQMDSRHAEEVARGVSLVGPHRDDVELVLGDLPAKGYASHGESWSYALALKLGGFQLLRADGIEPVLILDDVFAELDATRRERLAGGVLGADQVLVTAAVAEDLPAALAGRRYRVAAGEVTEDDD
ncbi:DNA replication and repair protein RecF [Raineyella antarctica]|uniref:DNA replication and repair protein RecF n=1 Tax=Raineyella antarctica TaxID=1577474 RepID=A0A1G6HTF8_9ACTN|nr:DNA replication/repair protein RecF [Raineyella antarctica]SDB97474.1 DNA replication and repair protein RecF [Raineyella antarctica]